MEMRNNSCHQRTAWYSVVILVIMEMGNNLNCKPNWRQTSCNPCYNGNEKHLMLKRKLFLISCNPCYNGNNKQCLWREWGRWRVVTLVIIEITNSISIIKELNMAVVTLVIMEVINSIAMNNEEQDEFQSLL